MSGIKSDGRTTATQFFVVTAAMEAGAGLALVAVPALVITFLFGPSGTQEAVMISRLAGAALVSLGAACWWARHDSGSAASRGLVSALLIYNAGVIALALSRSLGPLSPPLWGAVVLHGAMAVWCVRLLRIAR